jgi:hypothetical protein
MNSKTAADGTRIAALTLFDIEIVFPERDITFCGTDSIIACLMRFFALRFGKIRRR